MIAAKMLYLIQNESEISKAYGSDVAYCIGGKQVRILTPSGPKVFVLKQSIQQEQKQQQDRLSKIQQRLSKLQKARQQRRPRF